MLKTKDQYVGEREPIHQKRHGKGVFTYENKFFQYEGEWVNGVKHGHGVLRMGFDDKIDYYEGNFERGEIHGKGVMIYYDGRRYDGDFHLGEKEGYGVYTSAKEQYEGTWKQNMKHGEGKYRTDELEIEGEFENDKPHGICAVNYFSDHSFYKGEFRGGKKHGNGEFRDETNQIYYVGQWFENKIQGQGVLTYLKENYTYKGEFVNNEPPVHRIANIFCVKQIVQQGEQKEEEQANYTLQPIENGDQVEYEIGTKPISFQFQAMYQGPDIIDPVQPTEEEIQEMIKAWEKENKKNKNAVMPDFRQPRMKKATPVLISEETGRKFKVQLFLLPEPEKGKEIDMSQKVECRVDYREDISKRREQISQIKQEREKQALEEQQDQGKDAKKKKKETKKAADEAEDDLRIALYKPTYEDKHFIGRLENGIFNLRDLEFPEDHPTGKFIFQITDIGIKKFGHIPRLRFDLQINPQGGQDPKKKKK